MIGSVRRKTNMMRRHMSRVKLCKKTVHVYHESFVTSFRFRMNKSSEEQEHATLAAISRVDARLCPFTQKVEIKVLNAALSRTFLRVFVVPGKLMQLFGKDTLKFWKSVPPEANHSSLSIAVGPSHAKIVTNLHTCFGSLVCDSSHSRKLHTGLGLLGLSRDT